MHAILLAMGGLAVGINSTSVSGTATNGTNITSTASSTVTVSGGGTPTYLWEYVSGNTAITPLSSTAASTFWRATGADIVLSAVYRCKVTASSGAIAYSANVSIEITQGVP